MWCCNLEPTSNEYGMSNFMRNRSRSRLSRTSQYKKMQDSFDFNSHIKEQLKENFTSSKIYQKKSDEDIYTIKKHFLKSPSFHPDFLNSVENNKKYRKSNTSLDTKKHEFFKNKNGNFEEKMKEKIGKENVALNSILNQKRYPNVVFSRTSSQKELEFYKKSLSEKLNILGFDYAKFEEMVESDKKNLLKNSDANLQKFFTVMDKKELMDKYKISAIDYMFYSKKFNIFNLKKMLLDSLNFKKSMESMPLTARKNQNSLYFSQIKNFENCGKINRKLGYDYEGFNSKKVNWFKN